MVALSRNVSRKQAMEMLLTGETIDASTARDFGLVNRVVPREYLTQIVTKYAQTIASKSPLTLKIGKEAFYQQAEMGLAEAYSYTVASHGREHAGARRRGGHRRLHREARPEMDGGVDGTAHLDHHARRQTTSTAPSPSTRRWG